MSMSNQMKEMKRTISARQSDLDTIIKKIDNIKPILECPADRQILLNRYYQPYAEGIKLGMYDADTSSFHMIIHENEKNITVPRQIAKAFKQQIDQLTPQYEMKFENQGETLTIQHFLVYMVEGEAVRIPF
ncbi:hypothetical protein [Bacillus sp. es.034]|uniref:hypothetical protein n=1 Tax=Bacillus sp. es.034 TaxID=1761763 RepID=UPI000BF9D7B1|nr:hypothetical protein [Bacillus sp. es.034]PFG07711.1 hypothetical protein ATG71_4617 [Bacillus sp. es.034]